MLICPRRI